MLQQEYKQSGYAPSNSANLNDVRVKLIHWSARYATANKRDYTIYS